MYLYSMNAVRKIIEKSSATVTIELPEEYQNKKLEVIVLPLEEEKPKQYDFSDLVGTLKWKGDALKEQRKLRDEWE